jgi:hypothetical protein
VIVAETVVVKAVPVAEASAEAQPEAAGSLKRP